MNKSKYTEEQEENIEIMKTHLKSLRLIAGWKPQELADILGLSQQTILGFEDLSKDENGEYKYKISYVQYIALLTVFEQKAEVDVNDKDKQILKALLNLLFYEKDKYKEKKDEIDKNIILLSGAAGAAIGVGALGGGAMLAFATPILFPFGGIAALAGVCGSLIGKIVLSSKSKKSDK